MIRFIFVLHVGLSRHLRTVQTVGIWLVERFHAERFLCLEHVAFATSCFRTFVVFLLVMVGKYAVVQNRVSFERPQGVGEIVVRHRKVVGYRIQDFVARSEEFIFICRQVRYSIVDRYRFGGLSRLLFVS